MGICHHPHPTRCGAEVSGFFAFTSHSRIGSQVHFSLHPAHGEEERQCGRARGEWEKPSAGGYRPRRHTVRHEQRFGGPGNPSSPPAAVQMEDGLNRQLISPCRAEAAGGAGWGSAATGPHWQGCHRSATPLRGEVRGKEMESRRAAMLDWRGETDQGVEMNCDLRERE